MAKRKTKDNNQQDLLGSVGGQIDPKAYTDPFGVLYGAFKAEGGSMKDEPVAKRTMPLLDMGGQEMDLRAEGGFVPIGRMEKADDVPARLSKNEFVFTADAVRNAGDGDVDKGAEVMYNMMKNLEAGGDVSQESQGLEGAREHVSNIKKIRGRSIMAIQETRTLPAPFVDKLGTDLATQITAQAQVPVVAPGTGGIYSISR